MKKSDWFIKRTFDVFLAILLLLVCWWVILLGWVVARASTGESGFFLQERVGRHGKLFRIYKLRTMRSCIGDASTVSIVGDQRITGAGHYLRRFKIDELPQLINVLMGEMSFVGPRPDVVGFADKLIGPDRIILTFRPGITGPASLKYRDEEILLADHSRPCEYNRTNLWPDKVRINVEYVKNWSLCLDLKYIVKTIIRL